jgi:hypothetical protein
MKTSKNHLIRAGLSVTLAAMLAALAPICSEAAESALPSPPSITDEIIETESGIYYTVKKGDTLWDLSRKFENSPYLWPDLWSGNSQVANPHRIYPGERIRLYRRVDVERHGALPAPPEVKTAAVAEPAAETPMDKEKGVFSWSRMDQVGFIRNPPVTPAGSIFKVQGAKKMISTDDIVYITHKGGDSLAPGNRYMVYRLLGKVTDALTEEEIGYQHYMMGVVEITRSEPDYAVGRIIAAFGSIKVDDHLMPYQRRPTEIGKTQPPPGIQGEIIMAEQHNRIIGDHVTAFINRGRKDGVKVGQVYPVFYRENALLDPNSLERTPLQTVTYGQLVVVHVEENNATVYITQASQAIQAGASFASLN